MNGLAAKGQEREKRETSRDGEQTALLLTNFFIGFSD
jgi:hypothetical protein